MDPANVSEDVQPYAESIESYSENITIYDDQDVFQCGRCKQSFNTLVQFVLHKKEHVPESDGLTLHPVETEEQLNFAISSDPAKEIWVWNVNDTENECSNIILCADDNAEKLTLEWGSPSRDSQLQASVEIMNTPNVPIDKDVNNIDLHESSIMDKSSKNNELSSSATLTCSVCQRIFKKQFDLFLHLRSHTGEKPFQCLVCGRTFSHKSNLKKHISSHKVWPDGHNKTLPEHFDSELKYLCPYCQKCFSSHPNLRTHLKEHKHHKVYKCIQGKCVATFVDFESFLSHINNVNHPIIEYRCHICSAVFTSLNEIAYHSQNHKVNDNSSKKTFTCIYCHVSFKKHDHLNYHLATANHTNKCSKCDKTFVSEKALRQHIQSHSESKSYVCNVCNTSFRRKHYLASHILTHNVQKCFTCSICNDKFKRKDILVRHVKKHKPNQWKRCPFRKLYNCTMEFTRTDTLYHHIKTHTNQGSRRRIKKTLPNVESKEQSTIELIIVPMSNSQDTNNTPT